MVAAVAPCAICGGTRMKKKARKRSDVMLTGNDARRVMRFMTRDVMVEKFRATMDEGDGSMEKMIEIGNDDRLRRMTAARWSWDQETDAEAQMAELVDAKRHGAYRANRIHQGEVLRLDLNGTLDAFSRGLAEIRNQQLSRGVANGNSYQKLERIEEDDHRQQAEVVDQNPPAPEAEPATTATAKIEIVHPPIVEGSLADYNAGQAALENKIEKTDPDMYDAIFSGDISDINVTDVERIRRSDPTRFDEGMHRAVHRMQPQILNNHPSNPARSRSSFQEVSPPSDHPHVRDSERPAGDV